MPGAVPAGVLTLAVTRTGFEAVGFTIVPGVSVQTAFAMPTLQARVTLWLNDPAAVIWKLAGGEVVPREAITVAGVGVLRAKLTTCIVNGMVCVMLLVSEPTACKLKL